MSWFFHGNMVFLQHSPVHSPIKIKRGTIGQACTDSSKQSYPVLPCPIQLCQSRKSNMPLELEVEVHKINLKKLLTYKSKCAGAFGDHIRQSPNAPLVVKKRLCPTHSAKLQGGALYDQVLAVHAWLQVLSHRIQSPFRSLWKEPAPYGALDTLAEAPAFRHR